MKTKYRLVATVDRTVTDTIELDVIAEDEAAAMAIAYSALETFPLPQPEIGVTYCWVSERHQDTADIVDVRPRVDDPE